jgi:hypothetical protein
MTIIRGQCVQKIMLGACSLNVCTFCLQKSSKYYHAPVGKIFDFLNRNLKDIKDGLSIKLL